VLAGLFHQLMDRLDRPLGRHHRRRADLEHLHDLWRAAGAIGGDRRGHRFGVGALEHRQNLVFGLRRIEIGGDLVDALIVDRGHRVPPLQLDRLRRGAARRGGDGERQNGSGHHLTSSSDPPFPARFQSIPARCRAGAASIAWRV